MWVPEFLVFLSILVGTLAVFFFLLKKKFSFIREKDSSYSRGEKVKRGIKQILSLRIGLCFLLYMFLHGLEYL